MYFCDSVGIRTFRLYTFANETPKNQQYILHAQAILKINVFQV